MVELPGIENLDSAKEMDSQVQELEEDQFLPPSIPVKVAQEDL